MAAQKEVKLKVVTEAETAKVASLESKINELKRQKIQLEINANTAKLEDTNAKLQEAQQKLDMLNGLQSLPTIKVNDEALAKAEADVQRLKEQQISLQMDVETGELELAKSKMQDLENEEIEVQLRNQSAMEALDQIGQGFDRLKQGASEVGQQMGTILESAGKQETNKAFLTNALKDADLAEEKLGTINKLVTDLPGDDSVMQGLLGQAVAKDASLTTEELQLMGHSAADYFAGMKNYGKNATEAFQDMNNYLLTGQTREVEMSPLLANHIDLLQQANTPRERALALQQALNEEGWSGVSNMPTYNNTLETFNGMLERGRYNLGGMFQEGARNAMEFIMDLDEGTNGIIGMGLAALSFASPLADMTMGLGQMATGISAIKDLGFLKWLKELELTSKLAAAGQWLLDAAMAANPITIVVLAIIALIAVLTYLYFNNEQVRQAVDALGASLQWLAGFIFTNVMNAINWVSTLFQNFTNQLGLNTNDWVQAVLGFILFLPQLPLQIGIALANAIARALGFKGNFVQTLYQTAVNAVNGFANAIRGIGNAIQQCLDWAMGILTSHPIVQAAIALGNAIANGFSALGLGQQSPGKIVKSIRQEIDWTEEEIRNNDLTKSAARLGSDLTQSFNPNLNANVKNSEGNGGVTQVNNFYFNDTVVDNDDRMEKIYNYITRKLSFDNKTAGRTV